MQQHHQPGESGRISVAGLKSRGWTDRTIRIFLGEAEWTLPNPNFSTSTQMKLYDMERVRRAESNEWYQKARKGGKGSRKEFPEDDRGLIPTYRAIPPSRLDTQKTAAEQREAVAQVQHALGVPRAQIAQELGVSEATVRKYLRTPEQREKQALKEEEARAALLDSIQQAKVKEAQDKIERAERHQVRLSARTLYNTGPAADETAEILGLDPFTAGQYIWQTGVKRDTIRWNEVPPEELERRQEAANVQKKRREKKTKRRQERDAKNRQAKKPDTRPQSET